MQVQAPVSQPNALILSGGSRELTVLEFLRPLSMRATLAAGTTYAIARRGGHQLANHRSGIGFVVSAKTACSGAATAATPSSFALIVPLEASGRLRPCSTGRA